MRAVIREELKGSVGPRAPSPSLTRTSSGTPEAFPWVMSPNRHGLAPMTTARPQARFVAGEAFFNYGEFGSLRPGQASIELASAAYIGFAVHAAVCGFAYTFFSFGYGRLLAEYLRANDEQQVKAANYVLIWPSTLSILVGLVSDGFPIFGFRRKAYMIIGWGLTIAMCIVLIALDASDAGVKATDEHAGSNVSAFLVVSLLAAVGIQISWVSAIAASIEYAQREHIHHRGRHHATLLTLYYGGSACAMLLTWLVSNKTADAGRFTASISIGEAAIILAVVAAAVIPFVVFGYQETRTGASMGPRMTIVERLHTFWRLCHQNIVYRVLLFVAFHLLLLGFYDQNVRDAVQVWSGVDWKDSLIIDVTRSVAMMGSLLVWKLGLRNVSWRKIVVCGSLLFIAGFAVLTACATFDIVRDKWFYGALFTITDVPRAWLLLFVVHFAGEISEVGHEGVTVGLALSYQRLAALSSVTIASIFPDVVGFRVSTADVLLDSDDTRSSVTTAFLITVAVNLLCFPVIKLLPQQKLDAQQMRAFGGYNQFAGPALVVTLIVFIGFNLVANLVAVL